MCKLFITQLTFCCRTQAVVQIFSWYRFSFITRFNGKNAFSCQHEPKHGRTINLSANQSIGTEPQRQRTNEQQARTGCYKFDWLKVNCCIARNERTKGKPVERSIPLTRKKKGRPTAGHRGSPRQGHRSAICEWRGSSSSQIARKRQLSIFYPHLAGCFVFMCVTSIDHGENNLTPRQCKER